MCTVSFIARHDGYSLGMNRDEQRARAAALPPRKNLLGSGAVIGPSEPGGGTWIAVNEHGATLALINWYAVKARVEGIPISRGEVVNAVSAIRSPVNMRTALEALLMDRINPFRLIGVFPGTGEIIEWRWDLHRLARRNHPWKSRQWISSGFDEATAQRIRGKTFRQACLDESAGSLGWLRRIHRSHSPQAGPFSTCMHRADAATVSYTEVSVTPRRALMRYYAGAPCENSVSTVCRLDLR